MKKIFLITYCLPPDGYSGEAFFTLRFTKEFFSRYKSKFIILTFTQNDKLKKRESYKEYEIVRFFYRNNFISKLIAIINLCIFLLKNHENFEILQSQGVGNITYLPLITAKLLHKKVILRMTLVGGDDLSSIKKKNIIFFNFIKLADKFISISPPLTKIYLEEKFPKHKIIEIPQAVDINLFRARRNYHKTKNKLLTIGPFCKRKNTLFILRVFNRLLKKRPNLRLIIVGSYEDNFGEYDKKYILKCFKYVEENNLKEKVEIIQYTSEIEKYYQESDIFISASIHEGFSNVILEAMASGLPIVSYNFDKIPQWILGYRETLIDELNIPQFCKLISILIDNKEYYKKISIKNLNRIGEFDFNKIAKEYKKLYDGLL